MPKINDIRGSVGQIYPTRVNLREHLQQIWSYQFEQNFKSSKVNLNTGEAECQR